MKALVFFIILVAAKALALSGRSVPVSVLATLALIWQDALAAVVFAILISLMRREWMKWTFFAFAVIYIAFNVAVIRVLGSPLTWPMFKAARGTLSDSILHYLRFDVLAPVIGLIAVGCVLAYVLRKVELTRRTGLVVISAALALIAIGPFASSRIDTFGLERNSVVALVSSSLPRIRASESMESGTDWRRSPMSWQPSRASQARMSEDLSYLRDIAKRSKHHSRDARVDGREYLHCYGAATNQCRFWMSCHTAQLSSRTVTQSIREHKDALFGPGVRYPAVDIPAERLAEGLTESDQSHSLWLASTLKRAGYKSALFHSGRFMYLGMDSIVGHSGYDVIEDAGAIGGNRESSFGVEESATVNRMLGWVGSLKPDQKFFLTYLPIAGHHPYDTPQPGPFPDAEEKGRYLNALSYADSAVKALITGLQSQGKLENSLLIFAGDHGEAFGKHEGNYGHSLFIHDENVRVPLIIVAPGKLEKEVRVSRPVSLIDLAPTIVELEGSKIPGSFQGFSMLDGEERIVLFYTDYSLTYLGLRDGCLKYIHEVESGRDRIFDVCSDPDEKADISAHLKERVQSYRDHVMRWSRAQKAAHSGVLALDHRSVGKTLTDAQIVVN